MWVTSASEAAQQKQTMVEVKHVHDGRGERYQERKTVITGDTKYNEKIMAFENNGIRKYY